jgi:hypothetical protein
MSVEDEVLDHFLDIWREEVALEGGNALRRLGWDEVDANDSTMRSCPIHGDLGESSKSQVPRTPARERLTCDQLPGAYPYHGMSSSSP